MLLFVTPVSKVHYGKMFPGTEFRPFFFVFFLYEFFFFFFLFGWRESQLFELLVRSVNSVFTIQ